MHDDDPDDVVHNLFAAQAWGDTPAGPADRRHRGLDHGADPRRRSRRFYRRHYRPGNDGGGGGRQRRPRRPSCARSAGPSPATASSTGDERPGAAAARRRRARRVAPGAVDRDPPASSRSTSCSGMNGPDPQRRPPLRPRRPQHRARRRHLRRGSSRRCASAAGWPTRSTPSPPTTPTPAWSASPSAACPAKLDDVLAVVRAELAKVAADGHHRRGAGPRQGAAARRAGAGPGGLRLPDVAASARPSWSTTSCSASTR